MLSAGGLAGLSRLAVFFGILVGLVVLGEVGRIIYEK